jgi:tetratricopeptide (TPR) repeat protein
MLAQNRFGEAVRLLRTKPASGCDYRVDLLLAAAFDDAGDALNARHTLQQGHSHWPSNTSIATSLARYYLQNGDLAKAKATIAQCKPNSTTPLRELQMMAMIDLESQDLAPAESVAALAYHAYPSEDTLLFAANVLQLQGRYMDVIALLGKYRKDYADSSPFLITIAESESDGKMYAEAQQDLRHAIALTPDSYPAHYVLGNLLVKTGNLDSGIQEYRNAIQLSPRQPRTYYQLGRALEETGKNDEARSYFEQAAAVDPHYAPTYSEIAKLQLKSGQFQDAVDNLTRAIQYNPALPQSYYLLIQAYARLGEKDKSHAVLDQWTAYKKSHRLRPASPDRGDPLVEFPQSSSSRE